MLQNAASGFDPHAATGRMVIAEVTAIVDDIGGDELVVEMESLLALYLGVEDFHWLVAGP